MAKVTFTSDVHSISGRLSKKDGVIYSVNKKTGRTSRSDHQNFPNANTEDQQAQRTKFKTRSELAKTWWTTNKPAKDATSETAEWTAMKKKYDAQSNIGNKWSYVLAKFVKDSTFTGFTTAASTSSDTSDNTDGTGNKEFSE